MTQVDINLEAVRISDDDVLQFVFRSPFGHHTAPFVRQDIDRARAKKYPLESMVQEKIYQALRTAAAVDVKLANARFQEWCLAQSALPVALVSSLVNLLHPAKEPHGVNRQ